MRMKTAAIGGRDQIRVCPALEETSNSHKSISTRGWKQTRGGTAWATPSLRGQLSTAAVNCVSAESQWKIERRDGACVEGPVLTHTFVISY